MYFEINTPKTNYRQFYKRITVHIRKSRNVINIQSHTMIFPTFDMNHEFLLTKMHVNIL